MTAPRDDDLVQRLHALSRMEHDDYTLGDEAADVIERLTRDLTSSEANADSWEAQSDMHATSAVEYLQRAEKAEAENAELRSHIKEWICEKCSTVYPGPPQAGFKCVTCPSRGGATMPRSFAEVRELRAKLAAVEQECELTPRDNTTVEAMEFIVTDELSGKASILTASVRRSGVACLTLDYDMNGHRHQWSIMLTNEQRNALSAMLGRFQPRHYQSVEQP